MSNGTPTDPIVVDASFSPHNDSVMSPDHDDGKDESESMDMCIDDGVQNGELLFDCIILHMPDKIQLVFY